MIFMNNDFYAVPKGKELEHHGIKGMKWGVRRYQYRDGSLTILGREHYGKNGHFVRPRLPNEKGNDTNFNVVKRTKATIDGREFYNALRGLRKNGRFNRKASKLLNSDELVHIVQAHEEAMRLQKEANKKFLDYNKKYYPEWSGDGTELHFELMEKIPDYAETFNKWETAQKKAIKEINDEVYNPNSPLRELDKYTKDCPVYDTVIFGAGYQHVNPLSMAIGRLLDSKFTADDDSFLEPLGEEYDYALDGWV